MLKLYITRISPTHHTLEYRRDDGFGEKREFESKSILIHDFIHYSLESVARLSKGFFGLLSSGYSYDTLVGEALKEFDIEESKVIEVVVGAFTGVAKGDVDPASIIPAIKNMLEAYNYKIPLWLTDETLKETYQQYIDVMGKWNSCSFGETLELIFDVE